MRINFKWHKNAKKGIVTRLGEKYLSGESFSFADVKSLFYPILLDQSFIAFIGIFNSSMISSSGAAAVSAVNMVDSLNMFLMNFFVAIATGGTVVVAQYMGRKDKSNAGHAAAQSILSSTLAATVIAVLIIIFNKSVLHVLFGNADQEVMNNALIYLSGCCISYPFYAVFQSSMGALRGVGDSKASMFLSIVMNVLFLLGNVILIKFMSLGVYGIIISLFIARGVGCIMALIYLLRVRTDLNIKVKQFFHLDLSLQKSILYIGVPCASEQLFFHGGKIITQTFIVSLGLVSMTANAISGSLSMMLNIPENSILLCVVTIVGTCMGAGKIEEGKKFLKNMIIASSILTALICIVTIPFIPFLLGLYSPSPEIYDKAYNLMMLYIVGAPILLSFGFVFPGGLRAAGDAKYTSVIALLTMWMFRVTLGYVFGIVLKMDIFGVWLAMVLEWGVRGFFFYIRYKGDKWYKHNFL